MATAQAGKLTIRPLTAARVDDVKTITRGTWGSTCWDLFPRYTGTQQREMGIVNEGPGTAEKKRREALAKLARRRKNTPLLVAYEGKEPVGFVSLGPRYDYSRIANSKATPPVDEVAAWVIPCITVRRGYRGKGVAVAMLRTAIEYAGKRGAPAVEAYPRATGKRLHDDYAFIGTEAMFRKAGFRKIRGVMPKLPKGWTPRVTMRATCGSSPRTSSASPRRSKPAR
ncbi:MAG TPA: GNAT family N-acetyltransferase [Candidatus Limnocylindria bacterium]|nr:GNAT family N-acetyltransferase [Candidatus Limnocylindria bacterium]